MALPLAYFLTWTCYGQRLHGDARGSVDPQHNRRGTPYLETDERRNRFERERMTGDPVTLTPEMRECVDRSLVTLCNEKRWMLIARNVRATHAHVVVNCRGALDPERAMAQLKARATRDLRTASLVDQEVHPWTRHGSTRWINFQKGLVGAIAYVNDWQSGTNRELLEQHREGMRERLAALRDWLMAQGLPADGVTVVVGESEAKRAVRVGSYEPRTQ